MENKVVGGLILLMILVQRNMAEELRASFVFGDSLVDSGNNNYIQSLSKANLPDFGIDFKASNGQPTGRYCNGKTIPDIVGEMFGIPFAPPYLDPSTKGEKILRGVNYASGASGIMNETGQTFVGYISMWQQIEHFAHTRSQLVQLLGPQRTTELLRKSIFSINTASTDFLENYLFIVIRTPDQSIPPQEFQHMLLSTFRQQLMALYRLGARRFIVPNVGPIGCTPYQLTFHPETRGKCVDSSNQYAQNFNAGLKDMIIDLNVKLPSAQFLYANSYGIASDIINNPSKYGFNNVNTGCCGTGGPYHGLLPCGTPRNPICPDRSKFFFWDPYHPSEAANHVVARRLVDGDQNDIFPNNIRRLVNLP